MAWTTGEVAHALGGDAATDFSPFNFRRAKVALIGPVTMADPL